MKSCSKCGEAKHESEFYADKRKKDGLYPHCKSCHLTNTQRWKQANPGRHAAINQRSRERDMDAYLLYKRDWNAAHPESAARYRSEHREERAAYLRQWVIENKDQHLAYHRNWYLANREVCRARSDRRSAMTRGAHVAVVIDRDHVYERDSGRCHICEKSVARERMTLDHLVPLSKGGAHVYENVRVAHLSCNARRGPGRLPAQLLLVG